jgi:hypothetical protein
MLHFGQSIAIIPGMLILMIGMGHFLMPTLGYTELDLLEIPPAQRAHFVFLGTYAIGSFLVGMGLLTLRFARRLSGEEAVFFFGLMALVWAARTLLEFLYPVHLRIFFLVDPHGLLSIVLGVITVCYVTAAIAAIRRTKSTALLPNPIEDE